MSVIEKGKVSFIYIANPLCPRESRNLILKKHNPRKTLDKYLGPLEGEWAVSVSGRLVHKSEWKDIYLAEQDCVVIAPILMGGGGGGSKQILRIVALIALTYVTAGYGAALGGALGVSTAVAQAGMMIAGSMLINAAIPIPPPKMPNSGSDFNSSPTYGIDGPKNLSTRGIPVPVTYGEAWFAGNFISTYVENDGDTQNLFALLNLGEGPIEGISDVHVNDQPLANFTNVELIVRNGTHDQEVIPYFNDIIRPNSRGITLKQGIYSLHTVTNEADRFRLDIVMPKGISYLDDEDGLLPTSTAFTAEIREIGTSTWLPFNGSSASISISGKSMSPLRKSYYSSTVSKSKRYEMRFAHTQNDTQENVSNSITITDINEIVFDDIRYKHTALLGLKIKLSDQLNGIPKITYRLKGRKVKVYDIVTGTFTTQWTDNPAWIALDAMTNTRFGGGIPMSRFKLDYWRQWAKYCADNNLKFNGSIDQRTNLWDAIMPIFKAGRAAPVRSGTKFQVAIQGKRDPVQLFTMASIKKDSFSIDWLAADERANEVNVSYFDKTDFGKQKNVVVESKVARSRGALPKPTEMTLYGVDNLEQATREGTLAMNMNQLLKTVSFEAPIESIACTIGDVIAVQHDMPAWGEGGLTSSGSTTSLLKLDHPVVFEQAGQYVAMVRHDEVVQWTSDVETVLGNTVFLGFGFNVTSINRFRRLVHVPSGKDFQVLDSIIDGFGRHGVVLDSAMGILPGHTVQLVDTDVIEVVNVVKPGGIGLTPVTELTLATPLKAIPRPETPWAFGLANTVVGQFSILGISGSQDLWRKITAIEYNEEAYSDEVLEFKPAPVATAPLLSNVTFEGFVERRYLSGGLYKSEVQFSWTHSDPQYMYGEVHASINGEPWHLLGANASSWSIEIASGEIRVRIVPVNIQGNKPYFDNVTEHVKVVAAGAPENPPGPLNVRATAKKNLIEIKWGDIDSWAANKNIYRYEVWGAQGLNANIGDATLLGITGNDHYPHQGLLSDTDYTYWVRSINILANDKKSGFEPVAGLSVRTLPADTISDLFPGGIGLTDLDDELQSTVNKESSLEEIADIVSGLSAKVELVTDGNKTEIFKRKEAIAGVEAMVSQEIATLVTQDEALASLITQLEVNVGGNISARVATEEAARATADSALSLRITNLSAQVNDDIAASITAEQLARATADTALAAQITTLQAQVDDDISASITAEQTARASADSSLAAQITTVTSRVGNNETSISESASSIDGLKAQYTVKINSNGHVTGFGLASTATNGTGGVVSEFSIVADRFKVVRPGTTTAIPVFVVDTALNRVVIQNAIVGDLESDNYVAGVSGWTIKK